MASWPHTPAVLLAASVPYVRLHAEVANARERELRRARDHAYVASAHPERIRLAVMELTRAVLLRDARLVFGGHPAISPMVLHAARDLQAPLRSVLIFQSAIFERDIPGSTYDLADWQSGWMLLTPRRQAKPPVDARQASLTRMRELMVAVPGLVGAVFIGGMDGIVEESQLFHARHPNLPCYALASTGGAAALDLSSGDQAIRHQGRSVGATELAQSHASYAVLAQRLLDDMAVKRPQRRGAAHG